MFPLSLMPSLSITTDVWADLEDMFAKRIQFLVKVYSLLQKYALYFISFHFIWRYIFREWFENSSIKHFAVFITVHLFLFQVIGIITLEDIMEQLIQEPIRDEGDLIRDRFTQMVARRRQGRRSISGRSTGSNLFTSARIHELWVFSGYLKWRCEVQFRFWNLMWWNIRLGKWESNLALENFLSFDPYSCFSKKFFFNSSWLKSDALFSGWTNRPQPRRIMKKL